MKTFFRIAVYFLDAAILIGFVYASFQWPLEPANPSTQALVLPVARLALSILFSLRACMRLLPMALTSLEKLNVRVLIAVRHLRAPKSGFLTIIGLLSVAAVSVSSCALTTTLSVMGGFRNDLKQKILGNTAHISVDSPDGTVTHWRPRLKQIQNTPGVVGATPFVKGEVMVSSASNLSGAILTGIDPATVGVTRLPRLIRYGSLNYLKSPQKLLEDTEKAKSKSAKKAPEPSPAPDIQPDIHMAELEPLRKPSLPGVMIGQELARALRLSLGDEVNIVAPLGGLGPSGPMPKARAFRVSAIFYSGMYEYDMKWIYVLLETAQSFLGLGDEVTSLEANVSHVDHAANVAHLIQQKIGPLRARDWQKLNQNLFGALALEKLAMFIALGIAVLVASFCILGTLTLMIQEKARQVAVLKALGASDKSIGQVFVFEGMLIGLLGALIGMGLGYVLCFGAEHFGIRLNPEVYYIDKLPVHTDPVEFAWVAVASVVICLLVTLYPSYLASRLPPVEALRYE